MSHAVDQMLGMLGHASPEATPERHAGSLAAQVGDAPLGTATNKETIDLVGFLSKDHFGKLDPKLSNPHGTAEKKSRFHSTQLTSEASYIGSLVKYVLSVA